jgi:nucleoside-diphosphate-sugar epimerase
LSREALLITGINGFVGRGLAAALQGRGHLVKGTETGEKGDGRMEMGKGIRGKDEETNERLR